MMRLIGQRRAPSAQLGLALEAFDEPAFLVTEHGAVVFANPAASVGYPALPAWLHDAPECRGSSARARPRRPPEIDGRLLWLIVPRRRSAPKLEPQAWRSGSPACPRAWRESPSLARGAGGRESPSAPI